jgi:diguanylate cyclase (GGDEF)-like protein
MKTKNTDGPTAAVVAHSDYGFAVNLMQFLVVPTFVLDADGRVLIWNKACERLTGLPASSLLGTKDHWRGFYSEQRPCLVDLIIENRMAEVDALYVSHDDVSGQAFGLHAENWCVMPRLGHQLYLAIDAGPIYDADGHLVAAVETLRDMTVQKTAQIELERLATHDGLTGIVNRRGFDEKLNAEWRKSARDKTPLSLIMLDVDFFKSFNDTYGHQAGDECLKAIARELTKSVYRPADVAARYGGEEFALVLPTSDTEGALLVAERVRQDITALAMTHAGGLAGKVTVSMGVATSVPGQVRGIEELIACADKALYRAKETGRDRIVCEKL